MLSAHFARSLAAGLLVPGGCIGALLATSQGPAPGPGMPTIEAQVLFVVLVGTIVVAGVALGRALGLRVGIGSATNRWGSITAMAVTAVGTLVPTLVVLGLVGDRTVVSSLCSTAMAVPMWISLGLVVLRREQAMSENN